jgi:hypothetical protein
MIVYTQLTGQDLSDIVRVFDQAGTKRRIRSLSPWDENSGAADAYKIRVVAPAGSEPVYDSS